MASTGEGVSGKEAIDAWKVDEGESDGVKMSLGGELRRLARLVGESEGSRRVKLWVGDMDACANGDVCDMLPWSCSSLVPAAKDICAVAEGIFSSTPPGEPSDNPNPRPMAL